MKKLHSVGKTYLLNLFVALILGFTALPIYAGIFVEWTVEEDDTILGDSLVNGYQGQILASSAGGTFSYNECGRFSIVKNLDIATPRLIELVLTNRPSESVVVTYTASDNKKKGGTEFLVMTLFYVEIDSVSTQSNGIELPIEEVIINASSITYEIFDRRTGEPRGITEQIDCE